MQLAQPNAAKMQLGSEMAFEKAKITSARTAGDNALLRQILNEVKRGSDAEVQQIKIIQRLVTIAGSAFGPVGAGLATNLVSV
jgi:hypothetical protein